MGPVLPRIAYAVLVLGVLSITSPAEAGVNPFWKELGASASGAGVSQTLSPKAVFDGSVAVGPNGRPVVAYTEHPDPDAALGAITVKRWTGAGWETLSPAGGVGQGYQPQVRVSASGAIYVAWLRDDGNGNTEIRLRVRTASTFTQLGGSDSSGGISGTNAGITAPFSLALDADGNPIVAFVGLAETGVVDVTSTPAVIEQTLQVYVRRWTGGAWEFIGSDFTGGGASNAVSFTSAPGSIRHIADRPSLTVDSTGAPVVAFTYFTTIDDLPTGNTDIYVTRWNGSAWVAVGPPVPAGPSSAGEGGPGGVSNSGSGSFNPSLAAGADGRLALIWEEAPATGGVSVWVRVWNGVDSWDELAGSATGSGFTEDGTTNVLPQIAVDPDGRPIVAWQALLAPESPAQIFVRRWNGADAWEELGLDSASNVGISDAALDALAPSLALTPSGGTTPAGLPTVAWLDVRNTGSAQVFLRRFVAGPTVPLTVTVTGDGMVTSNPIGVECSTGTCVTEFPSGISVRLLPQGGPTGAFGAWSGACTGTAACTVTMSAPRSVNASFVAGAILTLDVLGAGGRVSSTPAGIASCADSCSAHYPVSTTVTLTAAVVPGGTFTGWGGACAFRGTSATCALPLAANASATASFTLRPYRLNVLVATPAGTSGQGTVGKIEGPVIACAFGDGICSTEVGQGSPVELVARPAPGNRFLAWAGGPCAGRTTLTCSFPMSGNTSITALFRGATGVQVLRAGNGSGSVTGAGFSCGADCFESVFLGTGVTLTPTPATGSNFAGWSGDVCDGETGACVFAAAGVSQTVSATFQLKKQRLSVTPTGAGFTTSHPAGIDCGNGASACTGTFDYGTSVALTATANPGFTFVSWTGTACTGSTKATCAITLKANVSATPNFRARTFLTVAKAGNGAGTVSGLGISCGADCSQAEFDARPVTLTATPAVGSRFAGFSAPCPAPTSPCTFTPVGNNQTVTATFELIPYTVTVANRANGAAVSDPLMDGITCGAPGAGGGSDCTATLDFGTRVVLRATPITGSRFVNWTGGVCAGSANTTCAFKIPAAHVSVSPNFKDVTALILTKSGRGAITSTPAGISCGTACTTATVDFSRGIAIALTPTPAVGWNFDGFTGDCAGTTCSVNASAPTALVGASFSIQHRRLTVAVVGQGSVGGGAACDPGSTPCVVDFDYGTTLFLTATAAPGHRFTGWSQSCAGTGNCSALMTVNRSVTATFKPQFGLTVTRTGNSPSPGTITASPAGISCGADCSQMYLGGTLVTLTRSAPVTGTTFRWGGDCAFRGTSATCALTLNANASVSADYSLQRLGLTVSKAGPRLGTVTGGGIDCGSDCTEILDYGTVVTLTAVPNTPDLGPAAEFVSWTGCTPATSRSCSFRMTANRTVKATFRPLVESIALKAISTAPLTVGAIRQLSAVANFTDGSTRDVTMQALWTSSKTSVATVSTTGLVIGQGLGNTSVTGTFRSHTGIMPVQVDQLVALPPPSPPVILVECLAYGDTNSEASQLACLPSGVNFSVLCKATGFFARAGAQDVTDQVTWISGNPAVAQSTGLVGFNGPIRQSFRIVGNGIAILRATESGQTSFTTGTLGQPWVVQGVASTVHSIEVRPATGNVEVGGADLQLQAIATLSSPAPGCGSPPARDFSTAVTWASSDEAVADVSFFGEVTGVAPGAATITATYGNGIAVAPATASITATMVPWASSDEAVADVIFFGEVTGVAPAR